MKYISLPKVADIIMGQSPPSSTYNKMGEGIPFFQGKAEFGDLYPDVAIYCDSPKKIAEPGDILISVRAPVGPTNITRTKACIGRGLAAIRCFEDEIDRMFLLYYLRFIEPQIANDGKGSTFNAIGKNDLENIEVPKLSLHDQKRIAAILEKADHLRRLRRYSQKLSDSFLQSVFLEMFGDPISNPMGWSTVLLGDHTEKIGSGITPRGGSNVYTSSGIRFIRSQNVMHNKFDFTNVAFINEKINKEMINSQVKPGDVLLNITGASIGRVACYQDHVPANVNQHVCIIRLDQSVIKPLFLSYLISTDSFQTSIFANESGATRQALNYSQIRSFKISSPPQASQESFVKVTKGFEGIIRKYTEGIRQSDMLYKSLMLKAYRGDV